MSRIYDNLFFASSVLLSLYYIRTNSFRQQSTTVVTDGFPKEDCEKCKKSMAGTVKHYDQHVIFVDSTDNVWSSSVENDQSSLVFHLEKCLSSLKGQYPKVKIKVTACKKHELRGKIIIYPEGLVIKVDDISINMDAIAKFLLTGDKSILESSRITVEKPSWKHLLLVCCHQNRDERCGKAGPEIIQTMQTYLDSLSGKDDVMILPSSHIGGHEYAGTLIVYPKGEWYGQVDKSNAAAVLDSILRGESFLNCLRGAPKW